MRLISSVRSVIAAFRASAALGRAYRSEREARFSEALAMAHEGLAILRQPYVRRSNPPEASALASLTILAEQMASELKRQGATQQDIEDAVAFLKIANIGNPPPELCSYIPFLESRLDTENEPSA